MNDKFTPILYQKIESKDDALKVIKYISIGFIIWAGVLVSMVPSSDMFVVSAIYTLLSAWLLKWKSRAAASLLFLIAVFYLLSTMLPYFLNDQPDQETNYIILIWDVSLSIVFFWAAVKVVEATFKFHGRYAGNDT